MPELQTMIVYGVAAAIVVFAALLMAKEAKEESPDGPPPERKPDDHEMRAALADLREDIRALHGKIHRCGESFEDEFKSIDRRLDRIEAAQSSQRLDAALARLTKGSADEG